MERLQYYLICSSILGNDCHSGCSHGTLLPCLPGVRQRRGTRQTKCRGYSENGYIFGENALKSAPAGLRVSGNENQTMLTAWSHSVWKTPGWSIRS